MRRDELVAALRRWKIVETLRALDAPVGREQARRIVGELRRRPDLVLAAVLIGGVVVMVLHWR